MTPLLRSALVVLLAVVVGCSAPQGPPIHEIAPSINATLRAGEDVVAPGDLLRIGVISEEAPGPGAVTLDPTFQINQDVRVQADGRASFIGVDDMQVAGLLPSQLDELLTQAYAEVLPEAPLLSVTIAEQAPRTVTVVGEVGEGGVALAMPPSGHMTLVEAMAQAGGPSTRTAWLSNTLLVRWDARNQKQQSWKIDARRRYWGEEETILLQPYDLVFVPNTTVDYVAIGVDNFVRRMLPFPNIVAP